MQCSIKNKGATSDSKLYTIAQMDNYEQLQYDGLAMQQVCEYISAHPLDLY